MVTGDWFILKLLIRFINSYFICIKKVLNAIEATIVEQVADRAKSWLLVYEFF